MRLKPHHRFVHLLALAGLLTATGVQAIGAGRECAHHAAAAHGAAGASDVMGAAAPGGAHGHAHHDPAAGRPAGERSDGQDPHESPCDCLGHCTVPAAAAVPVPAPVQGVGAVAAGAGPAKAASAAEPVAPLTDHRLPFPNAPPSVD
jgi:hypothetical protein